MPKPTFLNLPEDKRERILEAATDEFAARGYRQASITHIVSQAGIPKGSFYQYFQDKRDLFIYILQIAGQKKLAYLGSLSGQMASLSFFDQWRAMTLASLRFASDNPRLAAIANSVLADRDLTREVLGEMAPASDAFFAALLERGVQRGELDPGLDIALTAQLITVLTARLSDFLPRGGPIPDEQVTELYGKLISFVEHGIANRSAHNDHGTQPETYLPS
ncbi:MAG: TetR/AcrR family transcriptional regulator [Anaerolineae bacterium]